MIKETVFSAVQRAATKSGAEANQKALTALRGVNARIIEVKVKKDMAQVGEEPGASKAIPEDPFTALIDKGTIIEPPFDLMTLVMLIEHSTELGQCVEAYETNIDSYGHRYVSRVRVDDAETKAPEGLKKAVRLERIKLENFFQYASGDDSFVKFRRKLRHDYELTGNCYFEVIRNIAGKIQGFRHMPAHNIGVGRLEDEPMLYDRPILELQEDGSVKIVTVKEYKRFRMYVQSRGTTYRSSSTYTGRVRWFKQLGDPRIYDYITGEEQDESLPEAKRANELVHIGNYTARSPYGLPRYIGNLLSIFGDRAAEEINFITFRNNNIPSMVICVSNGQLTDGTIGRIESFVESQIQGSDNYSKFLILEAETAVEGEDGGQVKLDLKPLVSEQHKDALFQNYSANNQDKIRRAFRLPPIFTGKSTEYNRATAEASRKLADEQVFAPERDEFDELVNRILFPYMGVVYHKFKSNSPNTTDNASLVSILATSEKTGGMTPRIARKVLEDILGEDLGGFPVGFPADVPFSLTMAEAVKNLAQPTEPGQQFTAMKALGLVDVDKEDEEAVVVEAQCTECGHRQLVSPVEKAEGDPLTEYLAKLGRRVEASWLKKQKTTVNGEDLHDHEE
jgi:PBSX family phage portal protein